MDSLYRGLPDVTILHPDYKIYGKDILCAADTSRLLSEMKLMLSSSKCVTQSHAVTNIVNIYEQIRSKDMQLDEAQSMRLETCMRIKYPNRIHASPWVPDLTIVPVKQRRWCSIC